MKQVNAIIEPSNWYGNFSSGNALVVRLHNTGLSLYELKSYLFDVVDNKYKPKAQYKTFELEREKGTTGSSSIAINYTKANLQKLSNIFKKLGYKIVVIKENPTSSQVAKCRKVLAESERETHKPTISHYRDMKNGNTKTKNPSFEKVALVKLRDKFKLKSPRPFEQLTANDKYLIAKYPQYFEVDNGYVYLMKKVRRNPTTATTENPSYSYKGRIIKKEKSPFYNKVVFKAGNARSGFGGTISEFANLKDAKGFIDWIDIKDTYGEASIESIQAWLELQHSITKNPTTATVKRASNPKDYTSIEQEKDYKFLTSIGLKALNNTTDTRQKFAVIKDDTRKQIYVTGSVKDNNAYWGFREYEAICPNIETAKRIARNANQKIYKTNKVVVYGNHLRTIVVSRNSIKTTRKPNHSNADFNNFIQQTTRKNSRMFQGKLTGEQTQLTAPNGTPKNLSRLGELKLMIVKMPNGEKANITFDKNAYLAMDIRKNLHCIGNGAKINGIKVKGNGLAELGRLIQIDYVTDKKHINGNKLTHFYHKLGEVTGETPRLFVDTERFPIIHGGNYDVWSVGIVN